MSGSPQPTLVFLVRHGTTPTTGAILPGRAPGLHLSDKGKAQAASAGERLRGWVHAGEATKHDAAMPTGRSRKAATAKSSRRAISGVYASPLERTRETAAAIASALGTRVRAERGLLECDFGEWTGGSLRQLSKRPEWGTIQRYPSGFRFPGGESFSEMQTRIVGAVHRLCQQHPGEAIVAVSHADPIKAAVADAIGTHLDLFQRIVISPCSITAISYGATGPAVLAINSTATLGELTPS